MYIYIYIYGRLCLGNSVSAAAARNADKKINKGKSDDQPTRTRKSNRLKSDPESFSSRFPFFIKCLPPISVKGAGSVMVKLVPSVLQYAPAGFIRSS